MSEKKQQTIQLNISPSKFSPDLLPLINNESPVQLFTGTAGSGKSVFLIQRCVIYCLSKKYFRLLYCRKQFVDIRDSIFQGFVDILEEWNLTHYFDINKTRMVITCKLNGNKMIARGLDQVQRVKSIKDISVVFVDEMSELEFNDYAQLMIRLRTSVVKQTQFWGAFNPVFDFKWGREYFFKDTDSDFINLGVVESSKPGVFIYKTSFMSNPFMNAAEYSSKIIELASGDENYKKVYHDGNWGKSVKGNEYYRAYRPSIHVRECHFVPNFPLHISFDFNTLPYVALSLFQIGEGIDGRLKLRNIGKIALGEPNNSINATCQYLIKTYPDWIKGGIYVYGDASGVNSIPIMDIENFFKLVQFELRNYMTPKNMRLLTHNPKHNGVKKGSMGRRDFMANFMLGNYGIDLEINPPCFEMQEDLENVKQNENGAKLKKRITVNGASFEPLGHFSDTLDALVCYNWGHWAKRTF